MNKLRITPEGIIKLFLSFSLLGFSILVSIKTDNVLIGAAMLASSSGDFFIMKSRGAICPKDKSSFTGGIMMFAWAHFLYTCGTAIATVNTSPVMVIVSAVALFAVTVVVAYKEEKATIAYAIILIIAAVNGWTYSWVMGAGYIIFVISDAILAVFENKSPKWQVAIWGTYVPAQALILASFWLTNC